VQYNRARWYDPGVGRWISEDPRGFAAGNANVARYVGNQVAGATDPSGLQPPWFFILPPKGYRSWTDDERALIRLCEGDPELIRKTEILIKTLDNTWVWPFGRDRCHAWCMTFLKQYQALPAHDRLRIFYQMPRYIGEMGGWKDHGVITFSLSTKKVHLDKRLQGGSDHISFTPHPDLVYVDDPQGPAKINEHLLRLKWKQEMLDITQRLY